MKKKNKILVVAAHPDDEVLGCGGSLSIHQKRGDKIFLLFMTNGVSSRNNYEANEIKKRKEMAKIVSKKLDVKKTFFLDFYDNELDKTSLLTITKKIEEVLKVVKPNLIYTHSFGDLNIDHQKTFEATMTACRPQPNFYVKEIYSFEIPSSTGWHHHKLKKFSPNLYIDISKEYFNKKKLLKIYSKEMRKKPHARSVEAVMNLSKYRGSQVGLFNAEAFELIRLIK